MVAIPNNGRELRRTGREEGLKLLYGAALDVARQQGVLDVAGAVPSYEHSALERGRFKLRTSQQRLLAAVPVSEARAMMATRRAAARQMLDGLNVGINSRNPAPLEKKQIRLQPKEVRALAWAVSTGRRIPLEPKRRLEPVVSVLLLLCGVLPGVRYIRSGRRQRRQHQEELTALVSRWQMAGKPEPADSFFSLYHL